MSCGRERTALRQSFWFGRRLRGTFWQSIVPELAGFGDRRPGGAATTAASEVDMDAMVVARIKTKDSRAEI